MAESRTNLLNRLFHCALVVILGVFCLYLLALLVSSIGFIEPHNVFANLVSRESLFALKLSVLTAFLASAIGMLVAVPSAYAISRINFPGKTLCDLLADVPIVISPVALGTLIVIFLQTPFGRFVETNVLPFLFSFWGIVLAQFTVSCSLALRLSKSTFDNIDPRYEHVARSLGCTWGGAFARVTLPMARGGLAAAFILSWARALGEFGATVTVAGASRFKTETLPIAIYLNLQSADLDKTVCLTLLLVAIAVIVTLPVKRWGKSAMYQCWYLALLLTGLTACPIISVIY